MDEQDIFLSNLPADRANRRRALTVLVPSLLIFIAALPFARVKLPEIWAFIPLYGSALFISDLMTAILLFVHFAILRSRALLVLACGYLLTAVIILPHLLTFPGLFSETGLLGAGPQSTAWLYMFWHGIFPLAVICYVLLKNRGGEAGQPPKSSRATIILSVIAVLAIAATLTLLATTGQAFLPAIIMDDAYSPEMTFVNTSVWMLTLIALVLLWARRPHSVLDSWLMVVMCAWLFDVALSAVLNAGRFDLGFYAGRIYGLLAATFLFLMLLLETGALYARCTRLLGTEQWGRAREAERRLRLFDTSLDLILLVDRRGQFVEVSPSSAAILGYQPEEMAGHNGTEFLHPEDLEKTRNEMRLARAGHPMRNFECRHLHKDGRIVTLAWTGIWSEPEQQHYFIGRDVTISRRNERMKDEFVATVSHELRTPLTSIAGSLALLAGSAAGGLPDPVMRLIAIAHTNAQRLVRLINDILDIEKIESSKTVFRLGRVAAKRLVEQAIEANRGFAQGFGVSVRLDAASEEAMVRADPDRLMQVVSNLLSNAAKFSPRGQEVEVRIRGHEDNVRIAICDHGPGVPEEFKLRIFEKFAQADATDARQKGGTGLGLSIVKQIMTRLNGDVGFEPTPGGGTIFYVDLPRWDPKTMLDPTEQGNGTLILLCEDDPHSADILCDHLRRAGFNPDVVHTADEAMRADAKASYAAILVDLRLPDSDGITLIKHLRSQPRYQNTPIVVVSVDPTRRCEDERPSTLHVLDWLGKPVDIDRLIAVLNRPIVRKTTRRPRILHVSDDHAVLRSVADALRSTTEVVSVDSVKEARRALAENGFDAAILDVTLAEEFGLDLLPDLYGTDGHTIPVVVFSAKDTPEVNARVLEVLTRSRASIDSLIATLRKLVAHGSLEVELQKEVA